MADTTLDLRDEVRDAIVGDVRRAARGLLAPTSAKRLPSWLLYDDAGVELYEMITTLPEYYLTRVERWILDADAGAIVEEISEGSAPIALAELGAGTAEKTEALLAATVLAQGSCVYLACDVAAKPLASASARIAKRFPSVRVRRAVGSHVDAGPAIAHLADRQALLFIGSSIGNYDDADAVALLRCMRSFLRDDAALVLGTDLKKDPEVLLAAYDDAQGVTAAFNKNVLARLNREIGTDFDVEGFRHIAMWDELTSNIELYLEATRDQTVHIDGVVVDFAKGERIHTETSAKYDRDRIDAILLQAGFVCAAAFVDDDERFAVNVARVAR